MSNKVNRVANLHAVKCYITELEKLIHTIVKCYIRETEKSLHTISCHIIHWNVPGTFTQVQLPWRSHHIEDDSKDYTVMAVSRMLHGCAGNDDDDTDDVSWFCYRQVYSWHLQRVANIVCSISTELPMSSRVHLWRHRLVYLNHKQTVRRPGETTVSISLADCN